jgi:hypothetical protein
VLFGLVTILFFLMGSAPQAMALLSVTLILLPPVRAAIDPLVGRTVPWSVWSGSVAVLSKGEHHDNH